MLRNTFAAIFAAGLALPGAAHATDLYVPETPIYETPVLWPGFYIGAHIGGAFGNIDVTDTYDYVGDPVKESSLRAPGLLTGIQIGYNLQSGNIVYGIEAELGFMNLSGNKSTDLPPPDDYKDRYGGLEGNYSMEGGLYGDLTARLGYAADNTLFYIKGGAAFLNAQFQGNYAGDNCTTVKDRYGNYCSSKKSPSTFDYETSDTLLGWTVGVGVEYALSPSWSLKLEYQHFDFGAASFDHNSTVCFKTGKSCPEKTPYSSTLKGDADFDTTVDSVKIGVNYQIGKEDALQ
jgi:outer membrane immunogenic protein